MLDTDYQIRINQNRAYFKGLISLSMLYLIGWTTAYLMIYKMVMINKILEPGAIFLFPLSYAVADIITEVYGYRVAKHVVWSAFILGFVYCFSLKIVATLPGPPFWHKQDAYSIVFSPVMRAYFATTIASLSGSMINVYMISKFKILMQGKRFWVRSLLSTGIGELAFTLIGGATAYSGIEKWSNIVFLMLDGYTFKMIYALIAVWPASIVVYFLKKSLVLEPMNQPNALYSI